MKLFKYSSVALLVMSMPSLATSVDYLLVNSSGAVPAIDPIAVHSVAIGPEAKVKTHPDYQNATSNGQKSRTSGATSVAIGYLSEVLGSSAVAMGNRAKADGHQSIALGSGTQALKENSIAIGGGAKTEFRQSTAVGYNASAIGLKSIAIGNDAKVLDIEHTDSSPIYPSVKQIVDSLRVIYTPDGKDSISGEGWLNYGTSAIAIGDESRSIGWGSTALGTKAYALNDRTTSLGDDSKALGHASSSLGTGAYTFGRYSAAVGTRSEAIGDQAIAFGTATSASGYNSIATGYGAAAKGKNAIAIGGMTTKSKAWFTTGGGNKFNAAEHEVWNATGDNSIALGTDTFSGKEDSIALGYKAKSIEEYAMALGRYASATKAESVALGSNAVTDGVATKEKSATINGITYGNFAGQAVKEGLVVSVGNSDKKEYRQIKNVAAGNISESSTDAINGSQLYWVADKLAGEIKNIQNSGNSNSGSVLTGDISVNAKGVAEGNTTNGNLATVNDVVNAVNNTSFNITVGSENGGEALSESIEKVKAGETITYKAGKNARVLQKGKNITYSITDNPEFNTIDAKQIRADSFKAGDVSLNKNGIDAGNKTITHVADGKSDTDAVNVRQLQTVKKQIRELDNKVNKVDHKLRAGISQAGAMANIPQVTKNGGSAVGVGVANYRDESAISVGYSRLSDNGKHGIKTSVSFDSRGYGMVGAGYMYQW